MDNGSALLEIFAVLLMEYLSVADLVKFALILEYNL
jgi:hypothetical protein